MGMIIQSILLPKGMSMDVLMSQKGLEFLADADTTKKKEYDRYTKYEQLPVEKFDKESLTLAKIHENGTHAILGKLADEKAVEKALSMSADLTKKMMDMTASPMNASVATIDREPYEVSFGELFSKELSAFLDVVTGVMSQAGRDATTRKTDVLKALDAFGAFLSMSLDSLGEKAAKIAKPTFDVGTKEEGGEEGGTCPPGTERILVVDDEPVIAEMMSQWLVQLGYTVTTSNNSVEALGMVRENPNGFDLIVTDQTMPFMPGSELAKEVLSIRPDLPIILCTGYSAILTEEKAMEIGIKRYAYKPLQGDELARLVRQVLDDGKGD